MDCRLIEFILLILVISNLGNVNGYAGYKWIPLKSGDELPENATRIEVSGNVRYIGRARHFDEILPAEVTSDGTVFVSSCTSNNKIYKDQFEILTISDKCEWKTFSNIERVENIVRIGTAWNNEPIFVGVERESNDRNIYARYDFDDITDNSDNTKSSFITPIYLTNLVPISWFDGNSHSRYRSGSYYPLERQYLSCDIKTKWIDSSAAKLPNNTVFGGESDDDYDTYVAQLKRSCDVFTGQVIPDIGTATAVLKDGTTIEASYCQVLVGEPNQYSWVSASDGEIPDYAVVNGLYGYEPEYIARVNNTIGHLTYKEALANQLGYEILVMNQL